MSTWTEADLAAIDAALKTGASEVATADGKRIKFRSQAELLSLRDKIASAAGAGRRKGAVLLSATVRGG